MHPLGCSQNLSLIMKANKAIGARAPIIATMKLQQLKEFCVIAQCESLTKAAKLLHTSQPSLSRNLRALEEEFGTELFTRTGRNIVLNEAGRFALERIEPSVSNLEGLKHDVGNFIYDGTRSIDIYIPEPIVGIDEVITSFHERYPEIRLRISSQSIARLHATQPNLAMLTSSSPREGDNFLLVGKEPFVLMVSKANPLAKKQSVALSSLKNELFIRTITDPLHETSLRMLQEAGLQPHVALEDNDRNRIMRYVADGMGVCLAPAKTWILGWEEKVAAVPLSDAEGVRYLYLKWPEGSIPNWATLKFRDALVSHLNTTCGFNCQL